MQQIASYKGRLFFQLFTTGRLLYTTSDMLEYLLEELLELSYQIQTFHDYLYYLGTFNKAKQLYNHYQKVRNNEF